MITQVVVGGTELMRVEPTKRLGRRVRTLLADVGEATVLEAIEGAAAFAARIHARALTIGMIRVEVGKIRGEEQTTPDARAAVESVEIALPPLDMEPAWRDTLCKASEFLRHIDAWRSTKRHSSCARNVTVLAPSSKNVIVAAPIRVVCISGERRYCVSKDALSRSKRRERGEGKRHPAGWRRTCDVFGAGTMTLGAGTMTLGAETVTPYTWTGP